MEIAQLLRSLAASEQVKELAAAVAHGRRNTTVGGLCYSATALAFASLTQRRTTLPPLLFVMRDADEAGYFYQDLVQTVGQQRALYFPSSYRRAIKYNQRDAANEILRTEVLTRLSADNAEGNAPWVVTYPEALAEKVVSQQQLSDNILQLSQNHSYDFATLEQQLLDLGFQRVDYVYEPGQFALRGSIIDIYSYTSELPYRLDFFGDDIDSIRTFDVQTQLSDATNIESITIAPAINDAAAENDSYIPIFDFLPQGTVLITHNRAYICERVAQTFREGLSAQAVAVDASLPEYEQQSEQTADAFQQRVTDPIAFERGISAMRTITINSGEEGNIVFHTTPQPPVHKNFDLLAEECRRLLATGYRICILADSAKQTERLKDIFDADNEKLPQLQPITFEPIGKTIHEGFIDKDLRLCVFTDHEIFDRFHRYTLRSEAARRGKVALTLRDIQQLEPGDYVVHIDHGIGRFGGLVRVPSDGTMQEMIKITYQHEDTVYVSIHALHKISKYKGKEGAPPSVSRLGTGAWERMKERVKTKVKDIARDLIRLYAARLKEQGFAYSPDSYLQHELEASFAYEDTPDQLRATQAVKADMERAQPMDRLVCGDVGFGKTEIAVRAAFKAATDGKQVAVLVPTTVLAYQHWQTFCKRLKDFPVRIEYLSRARTAKEQRAIFADLASGAIDIIIGTHKLIGKQVQFRDLGLLIIDEEQNFGVSVKERLRQLKVNVDTLTLTATPIPRTLQFSLMGARDLSVIQTPPPNRHPIQTEVHTFSADVITEAINFEMARGGQVFMVNNRINNLPELEQLIRRNIPDARVCVGHGRMEPKQLEQIVFDFMNGEYDVMLSTTIVENGIDVPNANTIIINAAHTYGLSDLHQMRGRVGRGNRKAFCYLLAPPLAALPDDSRRRLQAIENFSALGSGLNIAMQDLDIRGAGNMLGAEQSGFIADLGYETYQKILSQAMNELRTTEFADVWKEADDKAQETQESNYETPAEAPREIPAATSQPINYGDLHFVDDCNVETTILAYYPDAYVPSSGERMALYRELDSLTSEATLEAYRKRLRDRFGTPPPEAEALIAIMPLKWAACALGVERLILKKDRMTLFLVSNRQSAYYGSEAFGRIITYATAHLRQCRFRESEHPSVIFENVTTIQQAVSILQNIMNIK